MRYLNEGRSVRVVRREREGQVAGKKGARVDRTRKKRRERKERALKGASARIIRKRPTHDLQGGIYGRQSQVKMVAQRGNPQRHLASSWRLPLPQLKLKPIQQTANSCIGRGRISSARNHRHLDPTYSHRRATQRLKNHALKSRIPT